MGDANKIRDTLTLTVELDGVHVLDGGSVARAVSRVEELADQ